MTRPLIREIVSYVCEREGVALTEFYGRSQRAQVRQARKIAAWLAVRHSGRSIETIAGVLKRDQSTIRWNIRRVEDQRREALRLEAFDAEFSNKTATRTECHDTAEAH